MSEAKKLAEIKNRLYFGDEMERLNACDELGVIANTEAARLLVTSLGDASVYVRDHAATWLEKIANDDICSLLLSLLREENALLRSQAMRILSRLGPIAMTSLNRTIVDEDDDMRILSATVMGEMKDAGAADVLISALTSDPNINVRYAAAEALGKIGNPKAINFLLETIKRSPYLAYPAIGSLGFLRAETTVELLQKIVEEDEWLRYPAIEALGNIAALSATDTIIKYLDDTNPLIQRAVITAIAKIEAKNKAEIFSRVNFNYINVLESALEDDDAATRQGAVTALGWAGKTEQIKKLLTIFDDEDELVQIAAEESVKRIAKKDIGGLLKLLVENDLTHKDFLVTLLGMSEDEQINSDIMDYLLTILRDANKIIRVAAAKSLSNFKSERVISALINCLSDQEGNIRRQAAESLGRLGALAAVPTLTAKMEDPYRDVRIAAGKALGSIATDAVGSRIKQNLQSERSEVREAAIQAMLSMDNLSGEIILKAFTNPDPKVRVTAIMMVKNRDPKMVTSALIKALLDEDWQVRKVSAETLGSTLSSEAVKPLVSLCDDENMWVRFSAARSLQNISFLPESERRFALNKLVQILKNNDDESVKISALESLAKIGDPVALGPIIDLAAGNNDDLRRLAAVALGRFPGRAAEKKLSELVKDSSTPVREAAAQSLAKIRSVVSYKSKRQTGK